MEVSNWLHFNCFKAKGCCRLFCRWFWELNIWKYCSSRTTILSSWLWWGGGGGGGNICSVYIMYIYIFWGISSLKQRKVRTYPSLYLRIKQNQSKPLRENTLGTLEVLTLARTGTSTVFDGHWASMVSTSSALRTVYSALLECIESSDQPAYQTEV